MRSVLLALALLAGCGGGTSTPAEPPECGDCHGSAEAPGPPPDTRGNVDPAARGVGAHAAHIAPGALHGGYGCETCHVLPETIDAPGHRDSELPAEVTLAGEGATWDATAGTCSDTPCHALVDATNPAPAWASGSGAVCGACHGLPPAAGRDGEAHPGSQLRGCVVCHPLTADHEGGIADPSQHVNGLVDTE